MNRIQLPLLLLATLLPAVSHLNATEELDIAAALGETAEARLVLPVAMALYETRRANRVMAKLAAGQEVTVLGMDAHGLKVRAQGPNGLVRGWISRKLAFGSEADVQEKVDDWYRRERIVADLAKARSIALNLTSAELERIFGVPTRRTLSQIPGGESTRVEKLEWVRTEAVDLGKSLGISLVGLDKDSPLARPEVETGRLTAECRDGVVVAFEGSLDPASPAGSIEVPSPLPCPFDVVAITPQSAKERAGN